MNIKELVSNGKHVQFEYYRKGELWYSCENGFMFPVPIKDTGDGTFLQEDKAMMFMRYIRKQLEEVDKDVIVLSEDESKKFMEIVDNPSKKPTEKLKDLMKNRI